MIAPMHDPCSNSSQMYYYNYCLTTVGIISLPIPPQAIPRPTNSTPPCYVAMGNFSQHKKDGDRWCSTPFYSGPQGYKMRLQVDAKGHGRGAGTHVSVFCTDHSRRV